MYILFPVFLFLLLLCTLLFHFRKCRIIHHICSLSATEKLFRLNELVRPFGFEYILSQDIFTSRFDAWQRDYGYCQLYDKAALRFNMIFDCEPIYFDYEDSTWLIEFWKGQYGINTGAEIGIYKADHLISKNHRSKALFHTVSDSELPYFELELNSNTGSLFWTADRHWWLTGFRMGICHAPEELCADFSVTFPSISMCRAFLEGALDAGFCYDDFTLCGRQISWCFHCPHFPQPRHCHSLYAAFSQLQNRIFLWVYAKATAPFCTTMDKLLYLYEYLPFAFRHMFSIQKSSPSRRPKSSFRKRKNKRGDRL